MAPPLPSPGPATAAHAEFSSALLPDLPLLMHGSGDVEPSRVDPDSVRVLADLTATYVARLVGAAVDAHDILTDGAGGLCPPPPPSRAPNAQASSDRKKRPREFGAAAADASAAGGGMAKSSASGEDFWDEPLPEPKVKKSAAAAGGAGQHQRGYSRAGSILSPGSGSAATQAEDDAPVPHDEWVGLSGVDVFSQRRRAPYASVPSTVGTQCFIFPICHDAALYGRVMEVQAARRNVAPMLLDPVLMDMVRDEGTALVLGEKEGAGADDVADGAEADAGARLGPGDEAVWPGLEGVLPTHRGEE